jgi:hypothetical protein
MSRPEPTDFGPYASSAAEASEKEVASLRQTIANLERITAYHEQELLWMRGAVEYAERRLARSRFRLVFGERREGP